MTDATPEHTGEQGADCSTGLLSAQFVTALPVRETILHHCVVRNYISQSAMPRINSFQAQFSLVSINVPQAAHTGPILSATR
jgi:hypothetical protein